MLIPNLPPICASAVTTNPAPEPLFNVNVSAIVAAEVSSTNLCQAPAWLKYPRPVP